MCYNFRTGFVILFIVFCLIMTCQLLFMLSFRQLLVLIHVQQLEKRVFFICYSQALFLLSCRTFITCIIPFQHSYYHCLQKLFPQTFYEQYWTKTSVAWAQQIINISHIWQNRTKTAVIEISALQCGSDQSDLTASNLLLLFSATESLTLLNMRQESKLLYVWKSFFYSYLLPWFWKQRTLLDGISNTLQLQITGKQDFWQKGSKLV